jgi:hypothetical protein
MQVSPTRAGLVLAGTLAYLGLAAFGAGGIDAFLGRPQFLALALITLALAGAALFTQGGIRSGEREDRANRWVLAAFAVLGLLDGYLPACADHIGVRVFGGAALVRRGAVRRPWRAAHLAGDPVRLLTRPSGPAAAADRASRANPQDIVCRERFDLPATLSAPAWRTSALKAVASTASPAWMSIARRVFPSRLALKSRAGSCSDAPLAKVSCTTSL